MIVHTQSLCLTSLLNTLLVVKGDVLLDIALIHITLFLGLGVQTELYHKPESTLLTLWAQDMQSQSFLT